MNFLKRFLTLCLFVSVLSSCQQENITPVDSSMNMTDIEEMHQAYIAKHGHDVIVEHTSLEEMNAAFTAAGMETITLEELGITQQEYDFAQERINNGDFASLRCGQAHYQFLGDMNGDRRLTPADVILASNVLLNTALPSTESERFGLLSHYWYGDNTTQLSTIDLVVANRVILGFPCP